jgi:hypothetical protein
MIHVIGCTSHLIPRFLQSPINLISCQQFAQPHDFVPDAFQDLTAPFVGWFKFQLFFFVIDHYKSVGRD